MRWLLRRSSSAEGGETPPGWIAAWRLANAIERRLEETGEPALVDEAIGGWEQIVARPDFARAGAPARQMAFAHAAISHLRAYQLHSDTTELARAVELVNAAGLIARRAKFIVLYATARVRLTAFALSGNESELRLALESTRAVLARWPRQRRMVAARVELLCAFARANIALAEQTRSRESFGAAAAALLEAIEAASTAPDAVAAGFELARLHVRRFASFGDLADLDEAVERFGSVADEAGDILQLRSFALADWGDALRMRFNCSGDDEDLRRSIAILEEGMRVAAPGTLEAAAVRVNLVPALIARFGLFDEYEDLEHALEVSEQAVAWLADDEAAEHRGGALSARSFVLLHVFQVTRDRQMLEDGLAAATEAVTALGTLTPARVTALVRLAEGLLMRFELSADVADASAAEEACREVLSLTDEGGLLRDVALRDLSRALRLRALDGDLVAIEDAVAYAEAALRLSANDSERPDALITLAMAIRGRYVLTGQLDDLQRMIGSLTQARPAAAGDRINGSTVLAGLCDAYLLRYYRTKELDDLDHSVEAGEAALAAAPASSSERAGMLALLCSALGEWREAHEVGRNAVRMLEHEIELLEEALRLAGPDSPFRSAHLRGLGLAVADRAKLRGDRNDIKEALTLLNEALAQTDNGFERVQLLQIIASQLWEQYQRGGDIRDADGAVTRWEEAVRLSVDVSAGAPVAYRLFQQIQWAGVYGQLVEALVTLAKVSPARAAERLRRAIVVAEGAKSRLLSEVLGRSSLPAPPCIDGPLVERERELVAQITALDKAELAGVGLAEAAGGLTPAARASRRHELVAELGTTWDVIDRSGNEGADYVGLRRGLLPKWEELAALAREAGQETALLSLFLTEDRTFLFVLRAGWSAPEVVISELGFSAWERILARFVREVHGHDGTGRRGETWHTELREFCERVRPHLAGARRVVISPENAGHLIPWAVVGERAGWTDSAGGLLPLVTVPALLVLARIRRRGPSTGKGTLVVGNPRGDLRFAEDEARAVAALENVEPIIGAEASKAAIQARLGRARTVHLATHAFFEFGSPLDSGVVLADDVLSARETITDELHADLVVLSACQTGMSDRLGGDEVAGLAQAFLFAGARSLVVSLWSVDDPASAETMRGFYRRLHEGSDKAAALAGAISDVRSTPGWSHPYFWGAFCLAGVWD